MTQASPYLFVYGTLRRAGGHPMAHFLTARGRLVGSASVPGRLYDLGTYPGMVEAAGEGECVRGEVYELQDPEATLATLDRYEGCGPEDPPPRLYERALAVVTRDDGEQLSAWLYLYRGPLTGARHIPSGDYLPASRPDAAP
jgi:gamma-glutamylcyclotransferase (GGCT)/AIG2-like uncharacterized protein YtfP